VYSEAVIFKSALNGINDLDLFSSC